MQIGAIEASERNRHFCYRLSGHPISGQKAPTFYGDLSSNDDWQGHQGIAATGHVVSCPQEILLARA